jgi:hypothetical protein
MELQKIREIRNHEYNMFEKLLKKCFTITEHILQSQESEALSKFKNKFNCCRSLNIFFSHKSQKHFQNIKINVIVADH